MALEYRSGSWNTTSEEEPPNLKATKKKKEEKKESEKGIKAVSSKLCSSENEQN